MIPAPVSEVSRGQERTDAPAVPRGEVRPRSDSAADRFMRRLLRVQLREATPANERAAHRGFQIAMVISGVRCLVTYLLIPVLAPILSIANVFAAPIGILLCAIAAVSGISSLRRFWASDHRSRWMYTAFIGVVFLVLAVAVSFDIGRIVSGS
nr:hypothetical protein [Leucobacter edaphi]